MSDDQIDLHVKFLDEFEDGTDTLGRIDYVLVVNKHIKRKKCHKYIMRFLDAIQEQGIKLDLNVGRINEQILFIKLHITQEAIEEFASIYEIDIEDPGLLHVPSSTVQFNFSQTSLSINQVISRRKGYATNMERILILYQLLSESRFGDGRFDNMYGVQKLRRMGAIKDYYPLHDGDCNYSVDSNEPLNDRQLLLKYWANFTVWYKEQPLNLIEKYYGTEVAFYFAWIGLYNYMLIPASFVGIVCFLIGVSDLYLREHDIINEICNSKVTMCPPCVGHTCFLYPLKMECYYAKVSVLFDNYYNVFFAIFMSIWATIFLNLWKRIERNLKIRWNVENVRPNYSSRLIYREKSAHSKISILTGQREPYTPIKYQMLYHFSSYGACLLLISIVLLVVYGVILYRIIVAALLRMSTSTFLRIHSTFIESVTSAILQVIFIKLYGQFYSPLSEWLTNLELPRTQLEFDNSVVQKRYFLGFTNNYAGLFYIAFFKGKFYSPNSSTLASIEADLCHPCGCLPAVCVQLFVLMLLKSLLGNIITLICPFITRRFAKKKIGSSTPLPQWEEEYYLYPTRRFFLTTQFMDMIIQYGFVTFFVAAFPLAPLCALINNCLELRLEAYELVTRYRRPVPKRDCGIGIWNKILQSVTQLSIVTNAFVLAFTSDFVVREIYRYQHNLSLRGYIMSTLSVYDMNDTHKYEDSEVVGSTTNSTLCYYRSRRYPPDHPKKYQLTTEFWYELGMRLVFVIVFEHVIIISNSIFSHIIPDASKKAKEAAQRAKIAECERKLALMDEEASTVIRQNGSSTVVINRTK